jgi:opacity protein-like surface antigen
MTRAGLVAAIVPVGIVSLVAATPTLAETVGVTSRSSDETLLAVRAPALSGEGGRAQAVAPPGERGGGPFAAGFVTAGLGFPAAQQSFDTLGLGTRLFEIGGGGQVVNLWRGLFLEAAATRWSREGRRVFVSSGGARFDLGISMRVTVASVDIGAGWRFVRRSGSRVRSARLVPYVGGAVGFVLFSESSDFAAPGEDVDRRHAGYSAFGGLEVTPARWLALAADVRYRVVPGALGDEGVSRVFGETLLGGAALGARLVVGPRW